MSRVSIKEVATGDVLNTSDANTTLDNWETATSTINPTNLREEGLDERCFGDNSVILVLDSVSDGGYTTHNGDWDSTPVWVSGNHIALGPFDLSDDTTTCIVRVSCEIALGANDASETEPYGQIAIGYSEDDLNWEIISKTKRNFKFHESVTDGASSSGWLPEQATRPFEIAAAGVIFRCITTIAHEFTASSSDTVYFGLFLRQTAHDTLNIKLADPYMTVEVFGR